MEYSRTAYEVVEFFEKSIARKTGFWNVLEGFRSFRKL